MALSKRESILAWGVGAVVGLLVLDLWVIEPFFAQRNALLDLRAKDADAIDTARKLRREEAAIKAKWTNRKSQGLKGDPEDAARQVLGALKDWAGETGVVIASVKPEYVESKKELREITLQASAAGSWEPMMKFLLKLHNAKFPIRVTSMDLGARNDSDELAIQLRMSTLYLTQEKIVAGPTKPAKGVTQ